MACERAMSAAREAACACCGGGRWWWWWWWRVGSFGPLGSILMTVCGCPLAPRLVVTSATWQGTAAVVLVVVVGLVVVVSEGSLLTATGSFELAPGRWHGCWRVAVKGGCDGVHSTGVVRLHPPCISGDGLPANRHNNSSHIATNRTSQEERLAYNIKLSTNLLSSLLFTTSKISIRLK